MRTCGGSRSALPAGRSACRRRRQCAQDKSGPMVRSRRSVSTRKKSGRNSAASCSKLRAAYVGGNSMDIGFIGLGNMGQPMVRRLIEAGHKLVVYDTRNDAVAPLVALGAQVASSPQDVADRVETVMASLPEPQVVAKVAVGEGGVLQGKRIKRFVDLSTTGARMAATIAAGLAKRDIVQIDSPVSGGVAGAMKGTLAVMVSGPKAEIDLLKDALAVFGKVFIIGEKPGMAQTMKLANNFLSATAMAATSEAVVMGVKAGL